MGRDLRQEALTYLLEKADKQGYLTFDDIMDCADANALPIEDFDWLSGSITTRGILIYDEAPSASNRLSQDSDDDDYDDFAQSDYEQVYDRIIELDESLKKFVTDVKNIKPPQRKEISKLKYQVMEGNLHARDRMIEMHLRVALKIALKRAETYDMDIQDAIGYACIGLVTAVDKYNPDANGAFSAYATMWIIQNISRWQPTQRALMYYPAHRKDPYFLAYPILKEAGWNSKDDLLGIEDAISLLTDKLSYTEEQAKDALLAATPFVSLEGMSYRNISNIMMSLVVQDNIEETVIQSFSKNALDDVLDTLHDRERQVLLLRYGILDGKEKTLEAVGQILGVTRERIRQIEAKAIKKVQQFIEKLL